MRSRIIGILSVGVLTATLGTANTLEVTVNTASLAGTPGSLAFDFIDGGPPSNSVTISGFTSDGTLGSATLTGGASGTLPGPVALTDSSFFNEYLTGFTFGSQLSFLINTTSFPPAPGSSPDEFAFYLLNSNATASLVTTSDPTGADALFTIDSTGATAVFTSSQETTTLTPASVPEPASLYLLAGAVGLLGLWRWRKAAAPWIAVGLVALCHGTASAQGITLTRVVDQSTARPDGQGNFANFHYPSTDGRYVVFPEQNSSEHSFWSKDLTTSTFIKLADNNTAAPGGTGNFTSFGQTAGGVYAGFGGVVRNGLAAFIATDTAYNGNGEGVYSVPAAGGAIQRVVNYNTPLPDNGVLGTPGTAITAIGLNDTGSVVFQGFTGGTAPDGTSLQDSVYTAPASGSAITLIADGDHRYIDPAAAAGPNNDCVTQFYGSGIGGNSVVYLGASAAGGFDGLYTLPVNGPAQGVPPSGCGSGPVGPLVVGTTTPLPGDGCTGSFCGGSYGPRYDFVQTDGQTAFFEAFDGSWHGIFSVPLAGGTITKIVGYGDTLPAIGAVASLGISFSVDNGGVVFLAQNASQQAGIFLAKAGQISKVLAYGDTVDGVTVTQSMSNFEIVPQSYKNGKLAFNWGQIA
ncbi:MAG: NF038129 family PEP-CTERM protein, partial [Acidobacteriia bacterium]|nr:NF038129 family PEP-CTERM protein [Terriglobia bacterium]